MSTDARALIAAELLTNMRRRIKCLDCVDYLGVELDRAQTEALIALCADLEPRIMYGDGVLGAPLVCPVCCEHNCAPDCTYTAFTETLR